jgi:hypothetical protein
MSASSPADLAVTFRSVPRRLREALGDLPPDATAAEQQALQASLTAVADLLRCPADPMAIADAVEHRPADEWSDGELDTVRTAALDIGRQLRGIAAAAPEAD